VKGKTLGYALIILVVCSSVEGLSYIAGKYLQKRKIFYEPVPGGDYEGYLSRRDTLLGWPSPDAYGSGGYDAAGVRISPTFLNSEKHRACISLYGDSFVWGSEVDAEHAWGNVLAKTVDCRVANYGVEGYGTDQAYLRFQSNSRDSAKIVILGIMPENIGRNLSQFRDIIGPKEFYSLKPRFVLDEAGELKLIPLPKIPVEEYADFVGRPEVFLEHDYFAPGGPSRVSHFHFPHFLAVARAFGHLVVYKMIRGEHLVDIVYEDFYRTDHPSQALQLMVGIVEAFKDECVARGRVPLVVIFPNHFSIATYQRKKEWEYRNLLEKLSDREIEVLNFGETIAEYLGDRDPEELFKPLGHYNEKVNRMVAESVFENLQRKGIVPGNR
jgi:hypothetical protein